MRQGGPGAGQHTKMVNQIRVASNMIGVCEAMLYAYRAGLDLEQVLDTIGGGAAASFSLATYGPRLLKGDLEPGFKIDHFIKDLGIALAEARRMRARPPRPRARRAALRRRAGPRPRAEGAQALLVALASMSAVTLPGTSSSPARGARRCAQPQWRRNGPGWRDVAGLLDVREQGGPSGEKQAPANSGAQDGCTPAGTCGRRRSMPARNWSVSSPLGAHHREPVGRDGDVVGAVEVVVLLEARRRARGRSARVVAPDLAAVHGRRCGPPRPRRRGRRQRRHEPDAPSARPRALALRDRRAPACSSRSVSSSAGSPDRDRAPIAGARNDRAGLGDRREVGAVARSGTRRASATRRREAAAARRRGRPAAGTVEEPCGPSASSVR